MASTVRIGAVHAPLLAPTDDWRRFYVTCRCGWESKRASSKPRKAYTDHLRREGVS